MVKSFGNSRLQCSLVTRLDFDRWRRAVSADDIG